jgi:hypothetical protein
MLNFFLIYVLFLFGVTNLELKGYCMQQESPSPQPAAQRVAVSAFVSKEKKCCCFKGRQRKLFFQDITICQEVR